MSKHNKKRNVGIIYEQIVSFMCKKLLEKDTKKADLAVKIVKKYFKEGTQLNREYKLFKALIDTNNVSSPLATSIIKEAKKACMNHFDNNKLENEKSLLIKDLNYTFGKGTIYSESIKEYRKYATIQTLLNEWRSNSSNFDKLTEYEILLHENLTNKKELIKENNVKTYNKLHFSLMNKLFNQKYSSVLNNNQKTLIEMFVNENNNDLEKEFISIKNNSKKLINEYCINCNNEIILKKYKSVLSNIENLSENDFSKNNLKKYLTVLKLKDEISGEE